LAPRVKVGSSKYTAHVSHWIEDGWTLTSHGKKHTGHAIRHIPGAHFMASASDETRDSASQALLDGLSAGLSNSLGNGEEI
jgi:hypothetical protein